jgi:hypothetical protein
VTSDETVTLRSSQRVGEDLVGDAVQSIVEVLEAATSLRQFSEYGKGPTPSQLSSASNWTKAAELGLPSFIFA